MQENGFVSSDAWLLLAVIYAGGSADRERLKSIGDAINRAIFTDEELDGGLARLLAAGLASEDKGRYSAAQAVTAWYEKVSPKRSAVHKDLERVEGFLGTRSTA